MGAGVADDFEAIAVALGDDRQISASLAHTIVEEVNELAVHAPSQRSLRQGPGRSILRFRCTRLRLRFRIGAVLPSGRVNFEHGLHFHELELVGIDVLSASPINTIPAACGAGDEALPRSPHDQ